MEINIEDNFALLFDKNNNIAYKALQELQNLFMLTVCSRWSIRIFKILWQR